MTLFRAFLLFVLAIPLQMTAQEQGNCEHRKLPVNVVDVHGQQISGLTTDQFRAEYQGQSVIVKSSEFESVPQRIVLLVDTSRSVSVDAQQWELVKSVANDIVSAGPPHAELALATFSSKFEANVGFGADRNALQKAIRGLAAPPKIANTLAGETALYDAILQAAKMLGDSQLGDVVYAITDGLDNESSTTTGKVLQYLEQRNIRLFVSVIHNGRFMPMPGSGQGGPAVVGKAARETGGYNTILETDGPKKSASGASTTAVHQLYALMSSFYLFDIELPKDPDKPRELKVTVVDSNGKKKKDTTILHSHNVFACGAAM